MAGNVRLPEGFVLDSAPQQPAQASSLPPGFVLDNPSGASAATPPSPEPSSGTDWAGFAKHVLNGIGNIPSDAMGVAKDVYQAVRHPIDTLSAMDRLAQGAGVSIGQALPDWMKRPDYKMTPEDEANKAAFDQAVQPITESISNPAGIPKRIASYAEDHPVRTAINASIALGAAGKIADFAGATDAAKALGTASEYAGPISGPAKVVNKIPYVRQVLPSNWLPTIYQQAKGTPYAQEGAKVAQSTGIDLTPAQETGSKALSYFEQTARDYPTTADQVRAFDVKQANQAIDAVNNLLDKIGPEGKGSATVGNEVQNTVSNAVSLVRKTRNIQADVDYGAVRAIAGDQPIIKLDTLKDTIQKIIDDYDVPGGEPIVSRAKQMLSQIEDPQTVNKAINIRRVFSDAAQGTGNIFGDLDKSQSRMLAGRMARAVDMDFELAPTTVSGEGSIRDALLQANSNYKMYSQHIDAIQNSVLGKMLGTDVIDPLSGTVVKGVAPEKVANKLLNLYPSELQVAKQILQSKAPQTWNTVRRYAVEQALSEGMDIPPSAGMNPVPLSSSKFINNLPSQKNLEILFDKPELKQLDDIQQALIRIGDRTTANTSKTSIISDLLSWFTPKGAMEQSGKMAGLKVIANAMTTPEGRAGLQEMVGAKAAGNSPKFRFLKDALISEYIAGQNYDTLKNVKFGQYNGPDIWSALGRNINNSVNSMVPPKDPNQLTEWAMRFSPMGVGSVIETAGERALASPEGRNAMERLFGRDTVLRTKQGEMNAADWLKQYDAADAAGKQALIEKMRAALAAGGAAGAALGAASAANSDEK